MTIKEKYQKMYKLAQAYNDCKEVYNDKLFQAFIANLIDQEPDKIDTTSILSDLYKFEIKWLDIWGDIQLNECVKESHEIEHKHNDKMCIEMLVWIFDTIEKRFMKRSRNNGGC